MMHNIKKPEKPPEPKLKVACSCNEDHAYLFPELMLALLWLAQKDEGVPGRGGLKSTTKYTMILLIHIPEMRPSFYHPLVLIVFVGFGFCSASLSERSVFRVLLVVSGFG